MSKTGLEIRWTERQKDRCVICIEVVIQGNSVHIYTDASRTIENKTSDAFCIPEPDTEHSARLTDITILAAELTAIKLALLWIINTLNETKIWV